jgi:hypothetical protein
VELLWTAIISALTALGAAWFGYWLVGKPRLITFSPISTFFELQPPDQTGTKTLVRAGQVIIQNNGRRSATQIQFTAAPGPAPWGYNLVPSVDHVVSSTASGEWMLQIPFLAPGEVITLQILNGPNIDSVRAQEGAVQQVPVMHQRVFPSWFNGLALVLTLIGAATVLFSVWRFFVRPYLLP